MVIRHDGITIDRQSRTITVGERSYKFRLAPGRQDYVPAKTSPAFEAISHLLLNGHTSDKRLFEVIYRSPANGGPNDGVHIMYIHYANWGHMLDALGLELAKEKVAGVTYRFLRTADEPCNKQRLEDKRSDRKRGNDL